MLLPELDDQLLSDLSAERDYVSDELDMLRASAASLKQELEDIWREEHEAVYELTSVFIHRGSTPQWGHYFFYSRHLPENPDSWFKYNDSEVGVVPKEEVLADTTGSTANPYMARHLFLHSTQSLMFPPPPLLLARFRAERVGHDRYCEAV